MPFDLSGELAGDEAALDLGNEWINRNTPWEGESKTMDTIFKPPFLWTEP